MTRMSHVSPILLRREVSWERHIWSSTISLTPSTVMKVFLLCLLLIILVGLHVEAISAEEERWYIYMMFVFKVLKCVCVLFSCRLLRCNMAVILIYDWGCLWQPKMIFNHFCAPLCTFREVTWNIEPYPYLNEGRLLNMGGGAYLAPSM